MQLEPKDALALWRQVMVTALRQGGPDMTQRQFALLLHVYLTPPPHTVRGLAGDLMISKPAVTRAIDRLADIGFLKRRVDVTDKRSVLIQRTVQGSVFLREFGDMVARVALDS